ncbi:MAG TPA: hypothetical protein VJ227_01725 [Patescibacteria group bacterium]|nr:hypothetical protein [Patescibacteria group bacterium]
MPEILNHKEIKFGKKVYYHRRTYFSKEMEHLATRAGKEYIGDGYECVVIGREGQERSVVAFKFPETWPEKAQPVFYLHKILSTLFPHNFPSFHTVFYESPKDRMPAGSIRQRINGPNKDTLDDSEFEKLVKFKFSGIRSELKKMGLSVSLDESIWNFAIGPDGGEYFLDSARLQKNYPLNIRSVVKYMQECKRYSPSDIRVVSRSITRLNHLLLS